MRPVLFEIAISSGAAARLNVLFGGVRLAAREHILERIERRRRTCPSIEITS